MISRKPSAVLAALLIALASASLRAQENYEIQVYPSETMPKGVTMFELHSNYTLKGLVASPGIVASNHAIHETVEITRGLNDWSELGFYWFTAKPQGSNFQWVGTHIRPRFRVPESWGWPVGFSISQEIGYSRAQFSDGDTWTYELRPIIDKQVGPWYLSLNPVLGKSLRGDHAAEAFDFTPNVDLGFDLTSKVNIAAEYYGSTGTIRETLPIAEQQHMLFGAVNLDFGPAWEFNLAYGTALTGAGDKSIVKMILGRRVGGRTAVH